MPGDVKEDANAKIPMIGSAVARLSEGPKGCWANVSLHSLEIDETLLDVLTRLMNCQILIEK